MRGSENAASRELQPGLHVWATVAEHRLRAVIGNPGVYRGP